MISRILLFWHSIRHSRAKQLFARLQLLLKRRVLVWLARMGMAPNSARASRMLVNGGAPNYPSPLTTEYLPCPIFSPRTFMCERQSETINLKFLNLYRPLETPMNWHPAEWEKGTRLEKLNLHYMEYLESLDDDVFVKVVKDWITQNKPYHRGYWLDSWNSYALSIRSVVWMQQYASRQKQLAAEFKKLLLTSLFEQIRFLARNLELDIGGNHLIKNIKALLWAGRFFNGRESRRWERHGRALLAREIHEQILQDGMHYERSPSYHTLVFADLLECLHVLSPGSERESLVRTLGHMAQALTDLTHPDKLISLFNDGGLNMARRTAECLHVYEELGGASVRGREEIRLPNAGYFGLRKEGNYFLADCGKIAPDFLPAHGHGDILAFEWDVDGRRIVVDAGVYEYHEGLLREYSRSTKSHNTVTVGDADQCEFWKSFRVGRRADVRLHRCDIKHGEMILEGSHDGFRHLAGKPIHYRRIRTNARWVEVEDRVESGDGQSTRASLLLHPECIVKETIEGIIISRDTTIIDFRSTHPAQIVKAWWMPDFGIRIPTVRIVLDYGFAPCAGGFTLESRRFYHNKEGFPERP